MLPDFVIIGVLKAENKGETMQIGQSMMGIKPTQPQAPTPPPGGNIENRQPPSEPSAPSAPSGQNDPLSQYVHSLDSEDGEAIKNSLDNLSIDGREALKAELESFKPFAQTLSQQEREKGFLEILNTIFTKYGGDSKVTGNLLSMYA